MSPLRTCMLISETQTTAARAWILETPPTIYLLQHMRGPRCVAGWEICTPAAAIPDCGGGCPYLVGAGLRYTNVDLGLRSLLHLPQAIASRGEAACSVFLEVGYGRRMETM